MSRIPLLFGTDPAPNYNWFGDFDYSWFDTGNPGNLSSIPYFETIPARLDDLLEETAASWSNRGGPLHVRIGFSSGDCETVFSSSARGGAGATNCTEACADPASLFTPNNLRACTALAGAALLVQNGTLAVDASDAGTREAVDAWGVPELMGFNASGVFVQVAGCIAQSCTVSMLGGCEEDVMDLASVEVKAENLGVISERLGRYCDGVRVEINSDIAGPGVLLSYFFQTSLVILFWTILKISRSWVFCVGIPFRFLSRRKRDGFQGKLAAFQRRLTTSRVGTAVTASLVEFQEVQTYFISSAQVATIIAYNPSIPDSLGANNISYAAVILNSGLAGFLNISSMGCIFLAQCALHKAGMRWWYIFTIMTISYILSLAMFALRNRLIPPLGTLWNQFKDDAPLPLCGQNPSPMTYCGQSLNTRYLDNGVVGYVNSGLGFLTWIGLFIDQLIHTLRTRKPPIYGRLIGMLDRYDNLVRRKSRFWKVLGTAYWLIIEFALICLVGYHLSQLVLILENVSIGDIGKWGFGQLIAVMVWAPTIVKCIYFNIFGVKGGFEERIPKDFQIIRENTSVEPSALENDQGLGRKLTGGT